MPGCFNALYVHVPFCRALCMFCGCNTRIARTHAIIMPYVQAVLTELALYRERLGIDSAMLGFALFAMAVGSVLTMPLTGWSLGRFGSRLPTAVLTFAFVIVTPLLISAG